MYHMHNITKWIYTETWFYPKLPKP